MKKTRRITTLFLIIVLLIGLSLILYPDVSNYWNSIFQSRAVATYSDELANLKKEDFVRLWEAAEAYNADLAGLLSQHARTEDQKARYPGLLLAGESAIMGYVEIPCISVVLPIYHGTAEDVLQTALGHLEWTSLPTGGVSTHTVISGHRGLPSAKLFTDLDQLAEGDIFMFQVLDRTMTYEVDQIKVVEPEQTDDLLICEGEDLCTLLTCTPYGVNTHRLLVRGHRVENRDESRIVPVVSDAILIKPVHVALVLGIPMMLILWVVIVSGDSLGQRENRLR